MPCNFSPINRRKATRYESLDELGKLKRYTLVQSTLKKDEVAQWLHQFIYKECGYDLKKYALSIVFQLLVHQDES